VDTERALASGRPLRGFGAVANTTIGVVVTDARLGKPECAKLASLGMLGFARALSPPHTPHDGDTLFAVSTGEHAVDLMALGLAAAEAVARAIVRAVQAATPLPGLPAARDLAAATPPRR
jgi:D-aminopeptidase